MQTKVAVYTRVSTDHEEQLTSMKNQKEYYEKYCIDKGYELVKLYADEGLSGTSPKRKEFLEMLEDAGLNVIRDNETGEISFKISNRKPKFKYIITKDVSRFSRNIDAMGIAKKLEDKNVYIKFENIDLDTEMKNWQFNLSLLLTFSQQESLDRAAKVSFAYKQRASKGIFHMSRMLYGYEQCPETKEYLINENEAKLVREIFDMYVNQNKGTKIISNELNNRGLTTKEGNKWRADGIKRMLKNEKYKGQVIVNKYTNTGVTGSNRRIERDKDDWYVYDDAIPAIVDKEVWNKAQEIMKSRRTNSKYGNQEGSRAIKSIFHHKIKCDKCDSYFVRVASPKIRNGEKVTEYIYICRNRRMHGTCDARGISHNVLEREILKLSKGKINKLISINLVEERKMGNLALEILNNKINNIEAEKKNILDEINLKKDQINKFFDSFLDGEMDNSIISATKRRIATLEEEIDSLEKKLSECDPYKYQKDKEKVEKRTEAIIKLSKKNSFSFDETLEMITLILVKEISENEDGYKRELIFSIKIPTISIYALHLRDGFELYNPDLNDQFNLNEYIIKLKK